MNFHYPRTYHTKYGKLATTLVISFSVFVVFAGQSTVLGQTGTDVEAEAGAKIKVETGKEKEQKDNNDDDSETSEEESTTKAEAKVKAESSAESSSSKEQKKSSESKGEAKASASAKAGVQSSAETGVGLKSHYSVSSASSNNALTLQTNQHLYKAQDKIRIQGRVWSGILDLITTQAESSGSQTVTVSITDKKGNNIIQQKKVEIDSEGKYSASFELSDSAQEGASFSKKGAYKVSVKLDVGSSDTRLLKGQAKNKGEIAATTNVVVVPEPAVFAVDVKEHSKFNVGVATNSTVHGVNFSGEEKKVSVTVGGESGTRGVAQND